MSEQKPVAWLNKDGVIVGHDEGGSARPLYLHPAPAKWDASAPLLLNDGRATRFADGSIGIGTPSDLIELAKSKGRVVEICYDPHYASIRAHKVPEGSENERMRLTSDGTLLTVHDGYYWATGLISDIREYLETLE